MAYILKVDGSTEPIGEKGRYLKLDELQKAVGGYIELVRIPKHNGDRTLLVINESGKLEGLPVNPIATVEYCKTHLGSDTIVGGVVVAVAVPTADGEELE